jgi:hypothetical protein
MKVNKFWPVLVILSLAACSKGPLDRLKSYKYEEGKPPYSESDKQYWINAVKNNTEDFKKAKEYCEKTPDALSDLSDDSNDICILVSRLADKCQLEKNQTGLVKRDVPKEKCDELSY